jgi:hypothetical protein
LLLICATTYPVLLARPDLRLDYGLFLLAGIFADCGLPSLQHPWARADIVNACLQRSFLWPSLRVLSLQLNMRVRNCDRNQRFVE